MSGLDQIRKNKQQRTQRQVPPPLHPVPAAVKSSATSPATGDKPKSAPAAAVEAPSSRPEVARAPEPMSVPEAAVQAPQEPSAAAMVATADQPSTQRPLPDLTIDWSDPVMHVVRSTRLSVASSVAEAFKAAAEQPGQPPQTSLIMAAVGNHLSRLPELVVARRPEQNTDPSLFYRRPTVPTKTDLQVPLYIRPNGGEDLALNRIVDWVNAVITEGRPGQREASRSEIVAAALAAEYLRASKRR